MFSGTGKALTGGGAAVPTGPTTTTSGDVVTFTGTSGQIADSGTLLSSLAPLASPTFTGTVSGITATMVGLGNVVNKLQTTKYAATFGDGASTSFVITHNLGTTDVHVQVSFVASPYQVAMCEVQLTSTNTITLVFAAVVATNTMRVVVIG